MTTAAEAVLNFRSAIANSPLVGDRQRDEELTLIAAAKGEKVVYLIGADPKNPDLTTDSVSRAKRAHDDGRWVVRATTKNITSYASGKELWGKGSVSHLRTKPTHIENT